MKRLEALLRGGRISALLSGAIGYVTYPQVRRLGMSLSEWVLIVGLLGGVSGKVMFTLIEPSVPILRWLVSFVSVLWALKVLRLVGILTNRDWTFYRRHVKNSLLRELPLPSIERLPRTTVRLGEKETKIPDSS